MSDHEGEHVEPTPGEYFADIATRLVERDLLAGEAWRVAYTIGGMLDYLVAIMADENLHEDARECAEGILMEAVNNLLYAHVHLIPGEQDIEAQAGDFAAMLEKAEEIRKQQYEKNEEE